MPSFPCPGSPSWSYDADGRIEVEGLGKPEKPWPKAVNQWQSLIHASAKKHGIGPQHLAAVMAIESSGKPGGCLLKADGHCNLKEGIGLMAITIGAAHDFDPSITEDQLRYDNALNIDLGARYLSQKMKKYGGDYVMAAVAYNAGGVYCGVPYTFEIPKEACPVFWGVKQGCNRRKSPVPGLLCEPSVLVPGKYNCTVGYPLNAVGLNNAAVTHFLGLPPLPPPPPGPGPGPATERAKAKGPSVVWVAAMAGVAMGFAATLLVNQQAQQRRFAR